jgi:hypothetical protein
LDGFSYSNDWHAKIPENVPFSEMGLSSSTLSHPRMGFIEQLGFFIGTKFAPPPIQRRRPMIHGLKKPVMASCFGLSVLGLSAIGCGTITGAAIGGATGAGIGAATHHRVEKSAIIGAGVGGTLGALYDIYGYTRRDDAYRD